MDVCGTSFVFVLRFVCLVSVLGFSRVIGVSWNCGFPCLLELESMNLDLSCRDLEMGLLEIVFPKSLGYAKSSATKVRLIT